MIRRSAASLVMLVLGKPAVVDVEGILLGDTVRKAEAACLAHDYIVAVEKSALKVGEALREEALAMPLLTDRTRSRQCHIRPAFQRDR
jgi:hypothetical protein